MRVQGIDFNVYENRWLIAGAGLAAIVAGVVLVLFRKIGQLQSDLLETKASLASAIRNFSSLTTGLFERTLLEQIKPEVFGRLSSKKVEKIRRATMAIERNPQKTTGYFNLARNWPEGQKSMIFFDGTEITQESLYRKVLELDSKDHAAYNNLGLILEDKAQQQQHFRLALKFVPEEDNENKACYLENLVNTLEYGESTSIVEGGPPVSRFEICRMVIDNDPESVFEECLASLILKQLDLEIFENLKDEQKENIWKAAIEIAKKPEKTTGYFDLAYDWPKGQKSMILFDESLTTEESLYRKVLELDSKDHAAYNNLGLILEDKAQQQQHFRLALKFVPDRDNENKACYLENLVNTLEYGESTSIVEGGPPVSRFEICRMVIDNDPESVFEECLASLILKQLDLEIFENLKDEQKENIWKAAIEIAKKPEKTTGYFDLAYDWPKGQKSMILFDESLTTEESLYRKVLELDSKDHAAYNNLGLILENKAEQQQHFRLALKFVPEEDNENKACYLENLVNTLEYGESTSIVEGGPPVSKLEICRIAINLDPKCGFTECRSSYILEQIEPEIFKNLSAEKKKNIEDAAIKIAKTPNDVNGYLELACHWPEGQKSVVLFDGTQATKESLLSKDKETL